MNFKLAKVVKNIINFPCFIPLILLLLAAVFFPLKGVSPSPDSSWYLSNATEIYNKFTMESFLIRRPVLPSLMAVSFHIFDYSVKSGFYVVRLFFVLNILLSYFIGTKLFNKATGLTFSLLILTSFIINRWSSLLLLDNILPFFLLLYILLIYLALDKSKYFYFILAGITLGVALLVKGVITIMFVPLPICLLIFKKYRQVKNIIGIGLAYLLFLFILSPWINQIISGKETLRILVGGLANFSYIERVGLIPLAEENGSVWELLSKQLEVLRNFTITYIGKRFILSPLFFLGMIYSFYQKFFRKSRSDAILLISVFLFFPIAYVVGKTNIRVGQAMTLYFLFYLMVANFLVNFPKRVVERWTFKPQSEKRRSLSSGRYNYKNIYPKTAIMLIISVCLLFQIFVGKTEIKGRKAKRREVKNFYELMTKDKIEGTYGFSFWRNKFELGHWANKNVRDTADWIKEYIPTDVAILCQGYYRESIRFFTKRKYKIGRIKNLPLHPKAIDKISMEEIGKLLFVWTKRLNLVGQFENLLLRQINKNHIHYIIITPRENFFSLYFRNNPNFSLVKTFGEGRIKIYKVNNFPVKPRDDFSPKFEWETYKYLYKLYTKNPERYQKEKQILKKVLGWPDKEITKFFSFVETGDIKGFRQNYEQISQSKIY